MQQAAYLQFSMLAAISNQLAGEIEAGTGFIVPVPRTVIPPPPFIGDQLTLNNINVNDSTVGAINTGTIRNLDVSVSMMRDAGKNELASEIANLTQALVDNQELDKSIKNEIAEQLEFLVAQVQVEPKKRTMGLAKSAVAGIRDLLASTTSLMTIWNKVEPLIKAALTN